jgi:outer membrane receptor protein involved in Fe transport
LRHPLRSLAACSLTLFLAVGPCATHAVEAQSTTAVGAAIGGNVVDQQNGLAVTGATVTLYQAATRVASTKTGADGTFAFPAEPPGLYDIDIDAVGYEHSRVTDEAVTAGGSALSVRIVVARATSSQSGLREIGRVTANSNRNALATTTVINRTISAALIQREANVRIGDALLTQSGVTSFSLDSAPGDDLNISIRGMRPSEAQTLVDGHPVGPMGLFNGTGGGFNYQLSPSTSLANVQIAYGTGGSALLGIDAIAGTIDFQTLAPTSRRTFDFSQSFGDQGRMQTAISATGTAGRLGYAASFGIAGTYGGFKPQTITQTGLLTGDLTSGNVAANTWLVSGAYLQRNDLLKLRYALSNTSSLQLTGMVATTWDDKTGEGDNDFITPGQVLYNAQQSATTCTLPGGGTGYVVVTDANPTACFTPNQYASAFSGPFGGSHVAWQSLRLHDYDGRYTGTFGRHNVVAEGFANAYYQLYDRNYGGFTNRYQTFGERVSDDIVTDRNSFGFGFLAMHQLYQAGTYGNGGPIKNRPDLGSTLTNAFLRDVLTVNPALQIFANANLKHSSVSQQTTLDPRLAFVYRPNSYDVWRISAGRGSEAPNAQLKAGAPIVSTQPDALNPSCGALNSIGSAPNTALDQESAKELEISYGHRLQGDSQIQIVGYEEDVTNVIFSNNLPLTSFGSSAVPQNLQAYLTRLSTVCGPSSSIANLALTAAANAGAGRFQGIDFTGRYRISPSFYADFGWDIASARYFGVPVVSQMNNGALRDGQPIVGVPFSKGTLGFDWTLKDRTEMRIDGYFVGRNNALLRAPYGYADAFVARPFGRTLNVSLGVKNLFNSAYDQYGRIGLAQFIPENQFYHDANAIQQNFGCCYGERFGLPQRSFVLTLSTRTH